ncbi:hypothetical protein ACLOAV_002009 [Pseudogymnoascus australis]
MATPAPPTAVSFNKNTGDISHAELKHSSTANSVEMSELKASKTIDTVHNDEAMKVLQNYSGDESWSPSEEKQVQRIIDWRLMPCLCATYCLQYYDKAMLGQAALFGIQQDLGLTQGNRYSMSSSIFYLGYIMGAYPAMVLAQRYPVERVTSIIVTVWGVCLLLTIVCTNYQSIYAQRFFLGLLESGVSPLFMLIVGSWYKKNEQAFRMGIWYSCTGYVSIVSPLINYGWGSLGGPLKSWKYMYIFAGAVTIVWGISLWFILPPDPIRTKIFNERQQYIAVARLRDNNTGVRNKHYKSSQIVELLTDVKFWLTFCAAFLMMITNGPISTFKPIIINSLGFNELNSLLLMMPGGAFAGTIQLLAPFIAMRFKNVRVWLIIACQMITTVSAVLLWQLPREGAVGGLLYAIYTLTAMGGGYAVLMGLQLANIAGYTKRSIASSGLYIGYCFGNFVGPLIFYSNERPYYHTGFITCVVTSIGASLMMLAYWWVCRSENKKRDATGVPEGFDHAYEDDLTDKTNPQFR